MTYFTLPCCCNIVDASCADEKASYTLKRQRFISLVKTILYPQLYGTIAHTSFFTYYSKLHTEQWKIVTIVIRTMTVCTQGFLFKIKSTRISPRDEWEWTLYDINLHFIKKKCSRLHNLRTLYNKNVFKFNRLLCHLENKKTFPWNSTLCMRYKYSLLFPRIKINFIFFN